MLLFYVPIDLLFSIPSWRDICQKKVMIFFSSCNSVKFHVDILNLIHLNCWSIHGKQKQQTRRTTFFDFCKSENGFLLCTDVAARGLDKPAMVCSFLLPTYFNISEWKKYDSLVWDFSSFPLLLIYCHLFCVVGMDCAVWSTRCSYSFIDWSMSFVHLFHTILVCWCTI